MPTKTSIISLAKKMLFNRIAKNMGWLFGDRIVRLGVGLVISVWIARYIGPVQFGTWNYAIAVTSLLSAFATMGLDSLLVRDFINFPENRSRILGTALLLRILGSVLVVIISSFVVLFDPKCNKEIFLIMFLSSCTYIFQAFDVIDFYFQSDLKSKFTVVSKFVAFAICCILRVIAIYQHRSLSCFVFLALFEVFLGAVFLIFAYVQSTRTSPLKWSVNFLYLKEKLAEAWPLILSGMVIMIYMRIDQVMIEHMVGVKQLGIYSAAVRISELWYMIPAIISTSFYPKLLALKNKSEGEYLKQFEFLFSLSFLISFLISLFITILAPIVVNVLYGKAYEASAIILSINIWSGIFVFLGVASGNYTMIENLNKIALYKTVLGAIVNIILNFVLIPKYQGVGAAIATLVAYGIAAYISNLLFRDTRPLFYRMSKAIIKSFNLSSYKLYGKTN
jgi:polysaccharide transporter, PST family